MPLHSGLGYVTVVLAVLGLVLTVSARRDRSARLSGWMYACFVVNAVVQLPTLATGVIDNAMVPSAAAVAPYNFFVGASFFTLTAILAVWRGFNAEVVWDDRYWLSYLVGALGNALLAGALIWLGVLTVGSG